jgi:hypothetical protein
MALKGGACCYTVSGRRTLHDNLRVNTVLMQKLMKQPLGESNIEYADNRISLFSAQYGKCAISGVEFCHISDIHCHHIVPKHMGGTDKYSNLILITETVHKLIHARNEDTINRLLYAINLKQSQIKMLNRMRDYVKLPPIKLTK